MRLSHYSELGKQGTAQEALQDCAVVGVEMEKSDEIEMEPWTDRTRDGSVPAIIRHLLISSSDVACTVP